MLALDRECRKGIIADMIDAQFVALDKGEYEFVNDVSVTITGLTLRKSAEKLPAVEEYMLKLVSEGG